MLDTAPKTESGVVAAKVASSTKGDRQARPTLPLEVRRTSESRMNRIARRAHEIYEARGGEHGKAMEDWLQAEREVDAAMEVAQTEE
jgi:hypothetical protein